MKLRPRTFQIYWDAHAWVGVITALLLHVVFFMGAFALFQRELNHWAHAGDAGAGQLRATPLALQPLLERWDREEPLAGKRRVAFEPERSGLIAYWDARGQRQLYRYSPVSGRLERARSELGSFLYDMHYLGPLPKGVYVAGVAALGLLFALLTGLFLHWKDLARQWFQFRSQRVTRTWASDLHKVLGVFGLPYQLMYAWTGAVLSLSFATVQPALTEALFHGDAQTARAARGDFSDLPDPTGKQTGQLPDLDAALARARQELPGLEPSWISIEHVGDEHSSVNIWGSVPGVPFGTANVVLSAADNALIGLTPATGGPFARFEAWFFGLHYASFAGYGVKLLYALLALAGCAVIVSGNLVWLERRDRARAQPGQRLLERLTAGWCAGLVLATSALFVANRALRQALPISTRVEQIVFWVVWALGIAWAWRERAWQSAGHQLLVAGAAFASAGLLDLLGGGGQDPVRLGVDAALLVLWVACVASGARLSRAGAGRAQRKKPVGALPALGGAE
ncbi:MAG TPA: PepSY-associated TM helix domain-containing protein [Polyangiaceae bacterium]|jgi:uncharacterized iron-regulated membrane protein|nr:PepSY-associated TM helix domain-containing protein [Polyangiaceae bacterium]